MTVPTISQGNNQSNNQDHYGRYNMSTSNYSPRTTYCGPPGNIPAATAGTTQSPASPYSGQQDYYRPEQVK